MPVDFHKDMDKYLTNKRKKRLFSDLKSKVMNKKAVLSYKAGSKFGKLKGQLKSKVGEIKKEKEPEKEITQEQINDLVEKKTIKREPRERIEHIKEGEEGGWKEIKIEGLEEKQEEIGGLEEKKRKIQENLVKIQEKEKEEKGKLVKLSEENKQREKAESEEGKVKRLELEEEIKILKEKERIEEDRLAELRKARRIEQMGTLRGRVIDILFKKRPTKEKDMTEEVRKDIRIEAKVKEAERQRVEAEKPKEDIAKADEAKEGKTRGIVPNISSAFERIFGTPQPHQAKPEVSQAEVEKKEHKPKKSFFSKFIQIRTAAEIAKEEEKRLKSEEEQALKDQSTINQMFQQGKGEVKTNVPSEEQSVNLSTLFPGENVQQEVRNEGDTINLGQDYKIKIVKN